MRNKGWEYYSKMKYEDMNGEDWFYFMLEEHGFINYWTFTFQGTSYAIIHGPNISWTTEDGTLGGVEFETVEEMLDARQLPGNLTLREIMLKIDKEDTVFGY